MFWRQWKAPKRPSIRRPPLPGLKKQPDGKRLKYKCIGGPLAGATIWLSDGNSAVFTMVNHYGRYECAIVATRFIAGETKWRPR